MVFSPSLPPNHSKTTRILPESRAAACRLAWLETRRTGPLARVDLAGLAAWPRRSGSEHTGSDLRVRPHVSEAVARELGHRPDRRSGRRSAGSPLRRAAARGPADERALLRRG